MTPEQVRGDIPEQVRGDIPKQVRGHRAAPVLRIAGYAALFDRPDGARDTIRPGAFTRTLAEREGRFPLYWQHRPERRIGWVEMAGEDQRGLRIIASIDNPDGRAAVLLRRRAVSGLSFGYRARAYRHTPQGRELAEIDLFEVSVVTHPLQHGARVHFLSAPSNAGREPSGSLGFAA